MLVAAPAFHFWGNFVQYPDSYRALAFHAWIQTEIRRLATCLQRLPQELRPFDVQGALLEVAQQWGRECDQAFLPSYAAELAEIQSSEGGPSSALQYGDMFDARVVGDPIQRRVVERHPVLVARVREHVKASGRAVEEAVFALAEDSQKIAGELGVSLGRILRLEPTGGDSHNGGKRVLRFLFENGTSLFYKPGSMVVDSMLNRMLEELALPLDLCPGRTSFVNFGEHGWAAQTYFAAVRDRAAESRYWRRAGALLAIADILNFSDGHFENIVAAGEWPTIVDNETFFQNIRLDYGDSTEERHSILFTGLIQRCDDLANGRGLMAGYQAFGPRRMQSLYPHALNDKTLNLMVGMSGLTYSPPLNRPIIDGRYSDVVRYRNDLKAGMEAAYRHIMSHRDGLLGSSIWLDLQEVRVRQLVRSTMYYLLLLRTVEQPGFGTSDSELLRSVLREKLHVSGTSHSVDPNQVVDYEIRALERMDIPSFYLTVNSVDLVDGDGRRYENFFRESAIEQMRTRIAGLDEDYIAEQCQILSDHLDLGLSDLRVSREAAEQIRNSGGEIDV